MVRICYPFEAVTGFQHFTTIDVIWYEYCSISHKGGVSVPKIPLTKNTIPTIKFKLLAPKRRQKINTKRLCTLAIFFSLCLSGTPAWANLTSTFDSSAEGWTINGLTSVWSPSGGNPGGCIGTSISTMGLIDFYFDSPNTWNGNWTSYINGIITFDHFYNVPQNFSDSLVVGITIGKASFNYANSNPVSVGANNTWSTFTFNLDPAAFSVTPGDTFSDIIANVTYFTILFVGGSPSSTIINVEARLDNVNVTAVP